MRPGVRSAVSSRPSSSLVDQDHARLRCGLDEIEELLDRGILGCRKDLVGYGEPALDYGLSPVDFIFQVESAEVSLQIRIRRNFVELEAVGQSYPRYVFPDRRDVEQDRVLSLLVRENRMVLHPQEYGAEDEEFPHTIRIVVRFHGVLEDERLARVCIPVHLEIAQDRPRNVARDSGSKLALEAFGARSRDLAAEGRSELPGEDLF